ncbi:hypothetical protein ACFVYR_09010 [Streptomyces sp. NPDC058284]|uniref:hypothetical protein n=1 Tax=unclassified Streptomyces TaxID=2593676 RepID=UPI0036686D98
MDRDKPPKIEETNIRYFRPFEIDEKLKPIYASTKRASGECIDGFLSSDPSTLRCFSHSQVLDPCWAREKDAVCPGTPWSREATLVKPKSMPTLSPKAHEQIQPWALEVQNPDSPRNYMHCITMGGATGDIAGKRISWLCVDGEENTLGYAVGSPIQKHKGPWMIYFAASKSADVVLAPIRTLWK